MTKPFYRWAPVLGLVLATATFTSTASADTVVAELLGIPMGRHTDVSLDGGTTFDTTKAGAFQWQRVGGTQVGDPASSFASFCIELTQHVYFNSTYTFDAVSLATAPQPGGSGVGAGMGAAKAKLLRELWGRHYAEVVNADTSAAFQVAAWEIIYDPGTQLNDGSFQAKAYGNASSAYLTLAQNWLDSLDGTGPLANLGGLSHLKAQDQVYATAIPLPNAVWAGLLLMGGLAVSKTRKAIRA